MCLSKNALRYNLNIIKSKTYRDEDNYDWYLYEFNNKKNRKISKEKKSKINISYLNSWFKEGIYEYNFKLNNGDISKVPEFITIKKKNGVITINDFYEREDNSFSFYSESQDLNKFIFGIKRS